MYRFWTHLLSGEMVNIDETTFQVLREPDRKNTTKSYLWSFRGGTKEHPAVIFEYHRTRNGDFLKDIFQDYQGYVMTDGYHEYERPLLWVGKIGYSEEVRVVRMRLLLFTSITESAKANGHEPCWYWRYVLERLPYIRTNEELDTLLPWIVKPEFIKAYFSNKK
ncbi:MAG: transposase [Leptospiraceae bacterium]|nr:transposase [Leptospiraceae bacterium]